MTLGTALFASVVLVLAVFHKPFRKVAVIFAAVVGAIYFGRYAYDKYKEHAYNQRDEACKERLGLLDSDADGWHDLQRVQKYNSCVLNPKRPLPAALSPRFTPMPPPDFIPDTPGFTPVAPAGKLADTNNQIVLIKGGETLKIIPQSNTDKNSQFDMTKSIPIVYLGHKQKFVIVCGNFGESGTDATMSKNGTVSCP